MGHNNLSAHPALNTWRAIWMILLMILAALWLAGARQLPFQTRWDPTLFWLVPPVVLALLTAMLAVRVWTAATAELLLGLLFCTIAVRTWVINPDLLQFWQPVAIFGVAGVLQLLFSIFTFRAAGRQKSVTVITMRD